MQLWLIFALYFACVGLLTVLANSSSLGWLSAGPTEGYSVDSVRWGYALGGLIVFALPAIVFANVFPPERFGFFRLDVKVKPSMLLLGALLMIVSILVIDQLDEWGKMLIKDPELLKMEEESSKTNAWFLSMPSAKDLFTCLLTSALAPALVEELFFRATVQQLFTRWTRKPHLAIWFSAFIFSLFHFNFSALPALMLAGLFLGYAFYLTGSLRLSILMHFLFNGTSILIAWFAQHNAAFNAWEPSKLVVALSFALSFVLFGLMFRFGKKPETA